MDRNEFTANAPGTLLDVAGTIAFLPNHLPVDLALSQRLLLALDGARGSLGKLDGRMEEVANDLLVQRPLLTREALKSTRIEGTYAMASEVLRHAAAGPPKDEAVALDNLEVIRYQEALQQGRHWIENGHLLGSWSIRSLHEVLLSDTRGADRNPGRYRDVQVFIGSADDEPISARFVPPPPEHVQALIEDLFNYLNSDTGWPGLIDSAIVHYQFETIHPFQDGNGRLGRLMIPLTLMSQGVISRPILFLSDYLDEHRDEYFDLLKAVSCEGDWESWITFFLGAVDVTARAAVARIEKITALHEKYRGIVRERSRSQAPLAAVELVMDRIFVAVSDVAEYAKCSAPTARKALVTLTELGIVEPQGDVYPPLWGAMELLAEAYDS